jgi:hypothetical protein
MSDRRYYDADGDYRGYSTSGTNYGPLIAIVAGLWGLNLLAKWCDGFLHSPHAQPYQAIASFYGLILALAKRLCAAFLDLNPTPYHNLNGVILLALAVGFAIALLYAVGETARRLGIRTRNLAGLIALSFCAPALVGLSWWSLVAIVHWLLAKAV